MFGLCFCYLSAHNGRFLAPVEFWGENILCLHSAVVTGTKHFFYVKNHMITASCLWYNAYRTWILKVAKWPGWIELGRHDVAKIFLYQVHIARAYGGYVLYNVEMVGLG